MESRKPGKPESLASQASGKPGKPETEKPGNRESLESQESLERDQKKVPGTVIRHDIGWRRAKRGPWVATAIVSLQQLVE